jgi:quinol monooxygenase YgiN
MSAPFIFVTTHTINDGKLDDYLEQNREFVEFLEANEPGLQEFHVYMNDRRTQVTFLFVFPDAEAADVHMQVASEKIGRGLKITETARLEVYGTPGPVLQQALSRNAEMGVPVSVKPNHLGGFSRQVAT